MITNSEGQIAIKYYQNHPHTVIAHKYEYAFVVRANICMSWIKPEDVDVIMAITKTCCGGNKNKVYRYANENDVRQWTNGGGR